MKKPAKLRKIWTPQDMRRLKELAKGDKLTRVIGIKFGRKEDAVQSMASEVGISLKPVRRLPYGTQR